MKSRILFISLAVVLALSVGLIGCDGGNGDVEPTVLIIGTARDTDESLAVFEGMAAGPVMREFVAQVNADGGVYLSKYDDSKDLEIDRREINVGTWDVGDVTADICADIGDGSVHFLWGGPGTDCIFTQAPIANGAQVLLLTFEGGATSIANNPAKLAQWPYVFVTLSYSDWYQLPVLADILEADLSKAEGTVKAYVVHIEGEHGDEYLATTEDNFDVVDSVQIPFVPESLDAVTVILDAKAALNASGTNDDYDIFCCFAYPDQVMPITGVSMAFGFDPPAMIFGPGANFGFYAGSFGEPIDPCLVNGIMSFTIASYNQTNEEITEVYDAIAARLTVEQPLGPEGPPGIFLLDYWGIPLYWAGLEMWLAAVEEVGEVDQTLIRNALAGFEANPVETILADETWFRMYGVPGAGGGNLDYLCHTGEIGQWQGCGVFETIGPVDEGLPVPGLPNYVVTANYTGNMQGLWGWLAP